jgi:tetratricopeptide (TPR) repeat protein
MMTDIALRIIPNRQASLTLLLALLVLLSSGNTSSAQVGALSGKVFLKEEGGKIIPLNGATIDLFRLDLPGKYHTGTDAKGVFVFAGVPFVGTYSLAVSAPDAKPEVLSNIKAGREIEYLVTLQAGDGKRLAYEEVTAAFKEERGITCTDKALSEIDENARINEILNCTFRAGNEALWAQRYDEAIKFYDEGLLANPAQAPFLTNKSVALTKRGVEHYNVALNSRDGAERASGIRAASQDFHDAAEAAKRAVALIQYPPRSETTADLAQRANTLLALHTRAEAMRLFVTRADPTQADEGWAAYKEYIALESDPDLRLKAQLDAARMLLDAGSLNNALSAYHEALASDSNNPETILGIGLTLAQLGIKDQIKINEAVSYLRRFVEMAPDHPQHQMAQDLLDRLQEALKANR